MRNVMKATTLESRFPLLSVEHAASSRRTQTLLSAFEVELPEVYTVTAEEYEAIHATWCKAIKVLPDYSVLHKQDWYVKERYRPDTGREGMGFLARSYEMHFNERPFLHHKCYLFLTKTTKERMRQQSNWNTLCRGHYRAEGDAGQGNGGEVHRGGGAVRAYPERFGAHPVRRLSDDELTGTEKETGHHRQVLRALAGQCGLSGGHGNDGKGDAHRRQPAVPAHPVGHGRPARCGGDGLPLRTALHRPFGLPPCRSPLPWACCFPATISTTSTFSSATATRNCAASRRRRGTCSRSRGTAARTR